MRLFKFIKVAAVTVEIYTNKMVAIYHVVPEKRVEVIPEKPFTSERMLIGHFSQAEKCIKEARKQLGVSQWNLNNPSVKIIPKAMLEDVSLIEIRAFEELGYRFGSDEVEVVL